LIEIGFAMKSVNVNCEFEFLSQAAQLGEVNLPAFQLHPRMYPFAKSSPAPIFFAAHCHPG